MTAFATDRRGALAITPVDEHGLPEIARLAHAIWPAVYQGILMPEQIANMLEKIYSPENLQQEMRDGHRFWIARQNGEAVGFVSGYRENERLIWVRKIYVLPDRQGQGTGRALIKTVINAFRPAKELRLLVNPHNLPAQRFYTRLGFTKIAEVPVRMGDWNFDDYLYALPLKEPVCTS